MDPLSITASIIAVIQAIGSCWKIYSSIKDAKGDIEELQKEVNSVKKLVDCVRKELINDSKGLKLSTSEELNNALEGCSFELQRLKDKLGPEKKSKFFGIVKERVKWPLTGPDAFKIVQNLKTWKQSINLALSIDQTVQLRNVNQKLDFASLPSAEGAAYGSFKDQHEPECLPNTRVKLLKDIGKWVEDPQGKCVFWLSGVAGTGKSTISRTIAKELKEKDQLAASFFFRRGERDRGDASKFFTTLASQLANHIRDITPSIQNAINTEPGIASMGHGEQFNKLIFNPLSQLRRPPSQLGSPSPLTIKVVLVIDALDECDREADQQLIVSLLSRLREIKTVEMRVFLTSRPELPLRLGFKELSGDIYQNMILHEIPGVEEDIALFLKAEFKKIQIAYSLPFEWPENENIQKLAKMAVPLFIFASTACRFIADSDPKDQLEIVISYQSEWHVSQLEGTYLPILHRLKKNAPSYKTLVTEFKQIVGTIINLASPLSIPSLSKLLAISDRKINGRLIPLHSVLDVPTSAFDVTTQVNLHAPVRMFHLSFRDFLSDQSLRDNHEFCDFWIDEKEAHRSIYKKCVELMSNPNGLRKNICDLKSPGTLRSTIDKGLIEQCLPPELQYACRYWVYHLQQSADSINDNSQVYEFLRKHLIHWLEAVSLSGEMSEMVQIVETLSSIVGIENGKDTSALIHDIKRFVRQNQSIIDQAPLQAYWSALIFAPKKSIVRSIFNLEETIPGASQLPRIQDQWDALLQTLEEHTRSVNGVVFSADGKALASASSDSTVRIWNAATGVLLQTLEHTSSVNNVAFSVDSKTLASASSDNTVKIWNTTTGALLQTLEHTSSVNSVAFSADGKTLASASNDYTVRIWNVATGVLLQTLEHTSPVNSVAFSADGKTLASASNDYTVRIWTVATGVLLRTLEGHTNWVSNVAFSTDCKTLASASNDCTVRIWNVATGVLLRTLEGHTNWVSNVAFSTDGKTLASTSSDHTIRVWDTAIGALLRTLEGHTERVNGVAFSADGKTLASASDDHTIGIWDAAIGTSLQTIEGHTSSVNNVAFSADGKTLASSSNDHTIRVWNTAVGALLRTLEGHTEKVNGVAFSADGKMLASTSHDRTVKIWNVATGALLRTVQHTKLVKDVVFSTDGKMLASVSGDCTIRIWDTATGAFLQGLSHMSWVNNVTFSADSKTLASVLDDRTVDIWNTATGVLLQTLKHTGWVKDVAFSADGKTLASASDDHTVNIWNTSTGVSLQTFATQDTATSISFSEDGRYIITNRESFLLNTNGPLPASSGTKPYENQHEPITVKNEWLAQGGERLLWLPYNYRPSCSALYDNTICLGHYSGGVSFFTFQNSYSHSSSLP
ncbi:uncharacterized protein DFL_000001 [Arthrobotrys flagrans]|uniref:Nephrocystin 3-like N-terminal domain-containing protein n=1 Tax=Arthrobotrys flagrans TaxID=97331 RepID=A0A437ADV4_ARTFL|nr:hypothetical protein DFL_000001 [Arthrobotrys flagrans]